MFPDHPVTVFCNADYLDLGHHPMVLDAAVQAVEEFGSHMYGVQAMGGYFRPHRELEVVMATFFGKQDAVLFPSGMLANLGLLSGVFGPRDAIFADEYVHGSTAMGGALSGAEYRIFRHSDIGHLVELLDHHPGGANRVIVVDGLFSADGDRADIAELVRVAAEYEALLVVDEAHSAGVLGPAGRGVAAAAGVLDRVDIVTGTFSKAFGSVGGYVVADRQVTDLIRHTSQAYLLSAGPTPVSAVTALAAARLLGGDEGDSRRERVARNALRLRDRLTSEGVDIGAADAHVVPVLLGPVDRAADVASRLSDQGLLTGVLVPPAVPFGGARLRLGVLSSHSDDDIDRAAELIAATVNPDATTGGRGAVYTSPRPAMSRNSAPSLTPARHPAQPSLACQHAIITGGSSGIGLATAAVLARRGAAVSLIARGTAGLESAAERLAEQGVAVRTRAVDVRDRVALRSAVDELTAAAGPCEILVTSAGISRPGRFLELSDDVFEDMVDTNYYGTLWAVRGVAADMMRRHSGTVITISSLAGLLGVYGYTAYGAAKFAVRGLAESLRTELRPHGVHVACVCPPDVRTPQLIEENRRKPAETFAIGDTIEPMTPQAVAEELVRRAVDRREFLVCSGVERLLSAWAAGPGMTGLRMYLDYMVDSVQSR